MVTPVSLIALAFTAAEVSAADLDPPDDWATVSVPDHRRQRHEDTIVMAVISADPSWRCSDDRE